MKYLILALTLMANMTYAETKIQTDLPLKYLSQSSSASVEKPMIIFLHGYGSDEKDLFDLKNEFSKDYTFLSVRAPLDLPHGGYQWFNKADAAGEIVQASDVAKNTKLILDFISAATKKYHTHANKVVLIGFSQGGIMNYEVGLNHPDSVKGIAALSGKILPTLKTAVKPGMDLKKLNIFIGHGTRDDRIPFAESTSADELLSKTTSKPDYHSYEGMGHSINQAELSDLKKWIEKILD